MSTWSVLIEMTYPGGAPDVDELLDLQEALAAHGAVVTATRPGTPGEWADFGARLDVEAEQPDEAIRAAASAILGTAGAAGLTLGPALRIGHAEATTPSFLERQLKRPAFAELAGATEIAELIAGTERPVSRQRASALTKRPDFPQPVAHLARGPVWTKDSIRNFIENWNRNPSRRSKKNVPKPPPDFAKSQTGKSYWGAPR